jgi:hypothetical protein
MTSFQKIAEAYLAMATTAEYRPEAPSDGLGNIKPIFYSWGLDA